MASQELYDKLKRKLQHGQVVEDRKAKVEEEDRKAKVEVFPHRDSEKRQPSHVQAKAVAAHEGHGATGQHRVGHHESGRGSKSRDEDGVMETVGVRVEE